MFKCDPISPRYATPPPQDQIENASFVEFFVPSNAAPSSALTVSAPSFFLHTRCATLQHSNRTKTTMALKISLFNHKGGVSKTTTAFNLGWMIASKGKRVL